MDHFIKDITLADQGRKRITWAAREMPVIAKLRRDEPKNLFSGITIGACLHITTETANLVLALKECGARIFLAASNPLSTQDDVSASLVKHEKISVFGKKGENSVEYEQCIKAVAEKKPDLVIDDGADLISYLHNNSRFAGKVIGATEETTTGVTRIRNLEKSGKLIFPVIAVNDAQTKHFFDNRYGTGQSTVDGILRATNVLIAGKTVVVSGYGWCGRGIAKNFMGLGAHVIVTEVSPVRALEAAMDGFVVMRLEDAARAGDIFVTATGNAGVIHAGIISRMKDGVILANAGHFNVEIDVEYLEKSARSRSQVKPMVTEYILKEGRRIYLLAEGRLVNLGCAEGHPSSVMDMSFANQFLALKYLKASAPLSPKLHPVPEEIDHAVASLKLECLGIRIDALTARQRKYLNSWNLEE
jgi:adenosylhomocysteinase